jgi:hypothetical protein
MRIQVKSDMRPDMSPVLAQAEKLMDKLMPKLMVKLMPLNHSKEFSPRRRESSSTPLSMLMLRGEESRLRDSESKSKKRDKTLMEENTLT